GVSIMSRLTLVLSLLLVSAAPAASPLILEARYPGASPQVMVETIAAPLEEALRGTEDVRKISSLCTDGRCIFWLDLREQADRQIARVLVQNRVAIATPKLPEECRRLGVTLQPEMDEAFEVLALRSSGALNLTELSALARETRKQLMRLPGVAQVTV